jgi:hypothetical protein
VGELYCKPGVKVGATGAVSMGRYWQPNIINEIIKTENIITLFFITFSSAVNYLRLIKNSHYYAVFLFVSRDGHGLS